MTHFIGLSFLYLFYAPLLFMLRSLLFFVPKVQERLQFEKRNVEPLAQSFKTSNEKADICFEFSSEGEYQQVASLIDDALGMGKKIELVFFSPSVEKAILELAQKYPFQVRYLRYPILGLKFSSWITAQSLVLVRYDFFPEFLVWSLKPENKLIFIWVSFKKERLSGSSISSFKQAFLLRAKTIIYASQAEEALGKSLGYVGRVFDFRIEQIERRISERDKKFSLFFPEYGDLKSKLETYPRHKRLIVGNAWPVDGKLLEKIPHDFFVLIVPHKLEPAIMEEIQKMKQPHHILLNKKGVLCELYADFGLAYVGGGFGVSVHSLLEPLIAGSEKISCGPIHERSTEYDLALSAGRLKEVKNSQEFEAWLTEDSSLKAVHAKIESEKSLYAELRKDILSC